MRNRNPTSIALLVVALFLLAARSLWEYESRARVAYCTLQRLFVEGGVQSADFAPCTPAWIADLAPLWLKNRAPHLFSTLTYIEFWAHPQNPKPDLDALSAMPCLEEVEITDSRVTTEDLQPLRRVPRLRRLMLRGTKVQARDIPKMRRDLPGVIIEHEDMEIGYDYLPRPMKYSGVRDTCDICN